MEDPDINLINTCIANYFFEVIHITLVGQVPQNANKPYATYKGLLELYVDSLSDIVKFVSQIKKIYEDYKMVVVAPGTAGEFADNFIEHYSRRHTHKDMDGAIRTAWMQKIIQRAVASYVEYIAKLDDYSFYKTEISAELKAQLIARLRTKIRHHGVQAMHEIYRRDRENVPKSLYVQLRKEYNKLLNKQTTK